MTIISATPGGSGDPYARLCDGLRMQFGSVDIGAIAARILEAEDADIHWNARVSEHYLGQHFGIDDDEDSELSRMAFLSLVADRWHAGVCLIDGDGSAVDLLWMRSFERREEACDMFVRAR